MKYLITFLCVCLSLFGQEYDSDTIHQVTLDQYLQERGYTKLIGHCYWGNRGSTDQPEFFIDLIKNNPQIKVVGEIGFNAGHSSELFLQQREDLIVYSFDIMTQKYGNSGKEYIDLKYPNRHNLIRGNSKKTIPHFFKSNPEVKFDLIFIDGGHMTEIVIADIKNMKSMAHRGTIVIVDDLNIKAVKLGWEKCLAQKIFDVKETFQSKYKRWGQCSYNFKKPEKFRR